MLNQFAVIIYLGFIAYNGHYIESNYLVHFLSLSLLFFDAAYISYKNVKCNKVLNHFSLLLLLLGWQFLLYLFDFRPISKAVSMLLLPVCFYQSAYFIQTFLFQSSAYRGQKALLLNYFFSIRRIQKVEIISYYLQNTENPISFILFMKASLNPLTLYASTTTISR